MELKSMTKIQKPNTRKVAKAESRFKAKELLIKKQIEEK